MTVKWGLLWTTSSRTEFVVSWKATDMMKTPGNLRNTLLRFGPWANGKQMNQPQTIASRARNGGIDETICDARV